MFHLASNLATSLTFPHSQMHKIADKEFMLTALRTKLQGRFFYDYGVIVQIAEIKKEDEEESPISLPEIQENSCIVRVTFSAITFKAQKNDILQILVRELDEEGIMGQIGPIQIKIPRVKMDPQLHYDSVSNSYRFNQYLHVIDVGNKILCKCFEVSSFMGVQMRILGSLPASLLKILANDSYE